MESTAGAPIANTKDDIKNVVMGPELDPALGPGGEAMTGGKATRKRRQRRRKTTFSASGNTEDNATTVVEKEKEKEKEPVAIVKRESAPVGSSAASSSAASSSVPAPIQKIVLAPKKKPAKVVLVPRSARRLVKKTFKARRIRMQIDNTEGTRKKQRSFNKRIDAMSDAQVRESVVNAKLARAETLAKAPPSLLREMLRDYHVLRGGML
uniref:Uncharacterized protein n=1 Tax=viral metagenome TaxID=1070528 RepID=A0A6C0DDR4_9ZZZZ